MNKYYFLICLLVFSTTAFTQERKGYETDHYLKRMAYFNENPIGKNKIVFLGNSITEGGKWDQYFPEATPVNRGIVGDNTEGMGNRIDEIIESQPNKLFILAGINDISQDLSNEQIVNNYRYIIDRVKRESPKTKIYVQSVLPINNDFGRYKKLINKEKQVVKLNRQLKKMASKQKCTFLNIYPLYTDMQGKLDAKYTTDGLHLVATAYGLWVDELRKHITP